MKKFRETCLAVDIFLWTQQLQSLRARLFQTIPDNKRKARGCRVTYSEAATETLFSLHIYGFVAQQQHQLGESNKKTLVCTTAVHFCCEASYARIRKLSFNGTDF